MWWSEIERLGRKEGQLRAEKLLLMQERAKNEALRPGAGAFPSANILMACNAWHERELPLTVSKDLPISRGHLRSELLKGNESFYSMVVMY